MAMHHNMCNMLMVVYITHAENSFHFNRYYKNIIYFMSNNYIFTQTHMHMHVHIFPVTFYLHILCNYNK